MADHDHSYKLLFAHPQLVRDLLEGFVGGDWLADVDFGTLERVSDSYITDDLRGRADDIVWRARCGEHYVYLLIEFQSSADPFMAVRVLTYVGLLYQDLIRAKMISIDAGLPPILPIVLHNGSSRWRAAEDLASLLVHMPDALEKHCVRLRFLLIDEGGFDDVELACQPNLVALLFRLENCRQRDRIEELVSTLVSRLRGSEHDSLRRAFAVWLERVILARLSTGYVSKANELWERQAMLSDWFDEREKELRQEGEVKLLLQPASEAFW